MRAPGVTSRLVILFCAVNMACFSIAAAVVGAWSDSDRPPAHLEAVGMETQRTPAPLVDLRGADLRGADFRGRTLDHVLLTGAQLQRADFRSADLSGALLTRADLRGALYDELTRWPLGFQPEAAGAVFSPTSEQRRSLQQQMVHA